MTQKVVTQNFIIELTGDKYFRLYILQPSVVIGYAVPAETLGETYVYSFS